MGVCVNLLEMDLKTVQNEWLLSEGETTCIYNCTKSYLKLRGNIHEKMLKDFTGVRK